MTNVGTTFQNSIPVMSQGLLLNVLDPKYLSLNSINIVLKYGYPFSKTHFEGEKTAKNWHHEPGSKIVT